MNVLTGPGTATETLHIIIIYGYSLYIPYTYFLNSFHIFPLECFLLYSVNSGQVLIAKRI